MRVLPPALAPLGNFKQWVLWIARSDPKRPGKTNKFPINPQTGAVVTAHDPANWLTFNDAAALLDGAKATGVGFVFTKDDPFFFIDIDDAFDGKVWSQTATNLCNQFQGAACEISNSGTGLHIIGTAANIPHGCRNQPLGLELYTEQRFVALTGHQTSGDAFHYCQDAFSNLVASTFPPTAHTVSEDWTSAPCDGWNGSADDDELVRRAMSSGGAGSVFGDKASFKDLWLAEGDKLGAAFPTNNDVDGWGRSEADAALCSHLAFWTGRDCERIDRLFRLSGLIRDKWEREDYARNTVLLACSGDGDVYNAGGDTSEPQLLPSADPVAMAAEQSAKVGTAPASTVPYSGREMFVNTTEQGEYFKGCVYVVKDHAILTPGGHLLDQGRFKAKYGGGIFSLDSMGERTTRNAWECLTENISLRFPKVDETTFAPELEPGALVDLQGTSAVNSYWPVKVDRKAGDASMFVDHVKRLLPMGNDAEIVMTYMAAIVQNPGQKFQWCPLIQGPQGNGKTILIECMTNAVGHKYCHLPNARDLGGNGSKFTAWLQRKLFIGVEEIYCADRREVTEMLKPLITNRRVEIQGKGADQITGDNRTNWLMLTNHKDAIPIDNNDRRYCILYCAQQSADEIIADGMDSKYFNDLYNWLRKSDGFAIVTNFLLEYQCDAKFNPSELGGIMRAPKTTSTSEAVILSIGVIEQEVLEAVEQGRPGFCAPWISSMALDALLKEIRRTLPNAKRPQMLKELGYLPHPNLNGGRVNNSTATDGGKTRLYIKAGHIVSQLTCGAEIAKRYDGDQSVLPGTAEAVFKTC